MDSWTKNKIEAREYDDQIVCHHLTDLAHLLKRQLEVWRAEGEKNPYRRLDLDKQAHHFFHACIRFMELLADHSYWTKRWTSKEPSKAQPVTLPAPSVWRCWQEATVRE